MLFSGHTRQMRYGVSTEGTNGKTQNVKEKKATCLGAQVFSGGVHGGPLFYTCPPFPKTPSHVIRYFT